ncbi:PQQ-binding-like beta-propeller repeat protein [Halobacteriovorax sp. JY17]|uniref:outer membrane protein assembly factor BamB family protein n=1 Tax=Halobacteriovorax sp. JY17 TaxID=2014617 RepID=UPI000C3A4278|nr:PQQ-binding-like beta-propeller repeat protein [Halobacteriovorax sp. JY17]PIK15947.1 MAG: hypothetical protein CES88_04255 [Halobacteriovorax sp. JY17]
MHKILLISIALFFVSCSSIKNLEIEGVKEEETAFRVMWNKNQDPVHQTGNLPIALNSPLIHDGILYVGHNQGYMKAYQLDNGKEVWSKYDDGAYHSKPVVYKDWVIYGNAKGRVFARHSLTGKAEYMVDLDAAIETQGVVYKDRIIFHTRNHKIFCLDVNTGKILWSYKRSVPYLTTIQRASKPLVYKDKIYVGFSDGQIGAFSLEEGVILWERRLSTGNKFVDVDSTPTLFKSSILAGSINGDLAMLDPNSGEIQRRLPYKVSRAPILYKGQLLVPTIFGDIAVLDKDLVEKELISISKVPVSSITPWKGGLAVSSVGGEILLLDDVTFKVRDHFQLGHAYSGVHGELDNSDSYLAALSSRNRLYVFK